MQSDDIARIPLRARDGSVRAYAIVDATDADFVNQWRWGLIGKRYVARSAWVDGRTRNFYLHRELMGLTRGDGLEVDHRDRNRLNHRRSNLRVVTPRANSQNVSSTAGTSSKYRGVTWDKRRRKWQAQVMADGKRQHLGSYSSEEEAAEVARNARATLMPYATD